MVPVDGLVLLVWVLLVLPDSPWWMFVLLQAVSCLQFSDSGGLLVSAGGDALVCVWLLAEVLDGQQDMLPAAAGTARVEPLHTW
jgi:hypothetical protein